MLTAPITKSQSVLVNEGTHIARVIGLIHLGTAEDTYMGEIKKFNKIRLTFELPEETKVFKEGEEAKPLVHSQEYTLSMGKKSNLRPIVEGIIGTSLQDEEANGFDFENLLGMPCLLSIKHQKSGKGTTFAKISSTSKLMKGQTCKPQVNPTKLLTFEKWSDELFNSQPIFIREKIEKSDEYKKLKGRKEVVEDDDLEIPF